jgi:hypothetical protein
MAVMVDRAETVAQDLQTLQVLQALLALLVRLERLKAKALAAEALTVLFQAQDTMAHTQTNRRPMSTLLLRLF